DLGRFDAAGIPSLAAEALDHEAASTLLARRAGVNVAPSVLDRLVEQAHGNALALVELPSALTEAQLAGIEPLPETLPLTGQVERIFLERVRRLPDATQRLLVIAAADESQDLAVVLAAAGGLAHRPAPPAPAAPAGALPVHGP